MENIREIAERLQREARQAEDPTCGLAKDIEALAAHVLRPTEPLGDIDNKQEKENTQMKYAVVESKRNPGGYCCEAINYEGDGEIYMVEFFSHNSKALAEEYAAWKNN